MDHIQYYYEESVGVILIILRNVYKNFLYL